MNVFVFKMSRTKDGVNLGMMIRKTFVFSLFRFECCGYVYICIYSFVNTQDFSSNFVQIVKLY